MLKQHAIWWRFWCVLWRLCIDPVPILMAPYCTLVTKRQRLAIHHAHSLTRRSLKKNSTSVSDHWSAMPLPLQHWHDGPSLSGRGFIHAMRQGRVWKKHPLGAAGLPHPAEPALHETRLSLGLQSNAPPPSNPRERTIPRRRDEKESLTVTFSLTSRNGRFALIASLTSHLRTAV
jgi:hypothetical protein